MIAGIKFDKAGLIPAIAQDIRTKEVLMLAYMSEESLKKTIETGLVHYHSRSRGELWLKGGSSGNVQQLQGLYYDCDKDSLLIEVNQLGPACHTGSYSCFFNEIPLGRECQKFFDLKTPCQKEGNLQGGPGQKGNICLELYALLEERKMKLPENSYSAYLFRAGLDKILQKVAEECAEVVIAAKNKRKEELVFELSDLFYHLLVLMVNEMVSGDDIKRELLRRRQEEN